ncbi:hypothetical protein V7166_21105 [Bacillus thuringiensis]
MTIFLQMNGYQLMISEDYATEFTVGVVKHKYSLDEIEKMIRENSINKREQERRMAYLRQQGIER